MLTIIKRPYRGTILCQPGFASMGANIPATIGDFGKRGLMHFVHVRNAKGGKFKLQKAFQDEGIIDMHTAMLAFYDIGFTSAIRPDHASTLAGESDEHADYNTNRTVYAHGCIWNLMEAISKKSSH